jgi:ribosome biogenesis GTPase A
MSDQNIVHGSVAKGVLHERVEHSASVAKRLMKNILVLNARVAKRVLKKILELGASVAKRVLKNILVLIARAAKRVLRKIRELGARVANRVLLSQKPIKAVLHLPFATPAEETSDWGTFALILLT